MEKQRNLRAIYSWGNSTCFLLYIYICIYLVCLSDMCFSCALSDMCLSDMFSRVFIWYMCGDIALRVHIWRARLHIWRLRHDTFFVNLATSPSLNLWHILFFKFGDVAIILSLAWVFFSDLAFTSGDLAMTPYFICLFWRLRHPLLSIAWAFLKRPRVHIWRLRHDSFFL